jgi:hypothetical protein
MTFHKGLIAALFAAIAVLLAGCPQENCADGEDNDGDGQTDCEDVYCAAQPECADDDDATADDDDVVDDDDDATADDDDATADDDDAVDDDDIGPPPELEFLFSDARHSADGSIDYDVYSYSADGQSRVAELPFVQEGPIDGADGTVYFARQTLDGGPELFSLDPDSGDVVQLTDDSADPAWIGNHHPAPSPDGATLWFTSWRADGGAVIRTLELGSGAITTAIDLGAGALAGGPRPALDGDGALFVLFTGDPGSGDMAIYRWEEATGYQSLAGTDSNGLYDGGPVPLEGDLLVFSQGVAGRGDACGPKIQPRFYSGQLLTDDDLESLNDYVVGRNQGRSLALFGDGIVAGLEVEVSGDAVEHGALDTVVPGTTAPPQLATADPLLGHDGDRLVVQAGYAVDCCGRDLVISAPQSLDLSGAGHLQWSFGDGAIGLSTVPQATHCYGPGTWQPVITQYDSCGRPIVIPGPLVTVPDCATVTDADGDGVPAEEDCDDTDPTVSPQAPESCDTTDSDCDGETADQDEDGDGDGVTPCQGDCDDTDPAVTTDCSDGDGDGVPADADCDDDDPTVFPGAPEQCNGEDDDCDGETADEDVDIDGDGFTPCEGDCDDLDPNRNPDAVEACDDIDSNCNGDLTDGGGDIDGDGIPDCIDPDADGDGHDDIADGGDDCDDTDATVAPGSVEICDGKDNDCDGAVPTDELDGDGDGFAPCDGDCNDADATVHPGAAEGCNGIDDDCDGAPAADETTDADGDGSPECEDCDDADPLRTPGDPEQCDGIDNDCDGVVPADEDDDDGDGWLDCEDCDALDAAVFPGAVELCNFIDDDCDTFIDEDFDVDGDGWTTCGGDCNDAFDDTHPGASESTFSLGTCGDGRDNDCNADPDCADPSCYNYVGCVLDDGWEENDTDAAAFPMSTGVYTQGVLCFEGVGFGDWFEACLMPGGSVTATVEHYMDPPNAAGIFVGVPFDTDNFGWTNPSSTEEGYYWWGELQGTTDLCTWYEMTVNIGGGC